MATREERRAAELVALDDYLRYGTDEERPKGAITRRAYVWTIDIFLIFLDGRKPSSDLAKEFIKGLEERGNSPSSINRHIWALKSYFRFSQSRGIIKEELKIRGLQTPQYYPRYLSDEEWRQLLTTVNQPFNDKDQPDYARKRAKLEMALLMAYGGAGLRCSEAIRLVMDDIIDEGYLRVFGKGGREDFVPVEPEVIRAFKEYIESRGANGRYVFPGKVAGTYMNQRTAQKIIKALCRRAGLPDVHVHSLRHTVGYQLRKGGAEERDIQDVLRHKNINTTKLYTHLFREDLKARLPKRLSNGMQSRMVVE